MGMENREWYRDEQRAKGKKASWDAFNKGLTTTSEAYQPAQTPTLDPIAPALKQATSPSDAHLHAQTILEARAHAHTRELWPAYGVFLFAFAMLGYTLYHLGN